MAGWIYPAWRGDFYPKGLRQADELTFASSKVSSIEINATFYALQRPASFVRWRNATPDGFVFSVKGPRFVTHMKKLLDVDEPLANFFASGVLALGPKLGPILWQLPPTLGYDPNRMASFFARLPRTTGAAAAQAEQHDGRLQHGVHTTTDEDRPLRHAVEVRHSSLADKGFIDQLRAADIAVVVADTAGKWPQLEDVTASEFVYIRLHGAEELYASGYTDAGLAQWASKIDTWRSGRAVRGSFTVAPPAPVRRSGRDVYVYFDNDVKGFAPHDAVRLRQLTSS